MVVPDELWEEFRKHRKRIRAPMTPYAEKLILTKLEQFQKSGANPVDILNESIERGWAGVFLNGHAAGSAGVAHPINANACKKCGSTSWTSLDRYRICEKCQ